VRCACIGHALEDRLLRPEEGLALYGFPRPLARTTSNDSLRGLVSQCMALPSVSVAVFSLLMALGNQLPGLWKGA